MRAVNSLCRKQCLSASRNVPLLSRANSFRFSQQSHQSSSIKVENPYTGEIHCEVPTVDFEGAKQILSECSAAQENLWKMTSFALIERHDMCFQFIDAVKKERDEIARDISCMMGKPVSQAQNEINGMIERAEEMIELSSYALRDESFEKYGFDRRIRKEPLGTILVIVPWNYPLMCAINSIIPAILCGNSVLLKLSSKTPLVADHFERIFSSVSHGNYKNIVKALHCDHDVLARLIAHDEDKTRLSDKVASVVFTGSVRGGYEVQKAASGRLINTTLELGGKDPAYVCSDLSDTQIDQVAEIVADGGMYNAGQSCCAVERVYCDGSVYDKFVTKLADIVENNYKLGNPLDKETNMGPLAQESSIEFLEQQVADAVSKGAKLVAGTGMKCTEPELNNRAFFSPTVVSDCDHSMDIMREESFGPVLPIQRVDGDQEAVKLMNDSEYGLTAALFTNDAARAERMAKQIETGTVFMNRCDYLDPILPWTGVKDTGKGVSLSPHCFEYFTKLKAFHFKQQL